MNYFMVVVFACSSIGLFCFESTPFIRFIFAPGLAILACAAYIGGRWLMQDAIEAETKQRAADEIAKNRDSYPP